MKTDYIYYATPGKDSGESWRFDNCNLLIVLYFLIELWGVYHSTFDDKLLVMVSLKQKITQSHRHFR